MHISISSFSHMYIYMYILACTYVHAGSSSLYKNKKIGLYA